LEVEGELSVEEEIYPTLDVGGSMLYRYLSETETEGGRV
jgi:hypothetical protein